MKPVQTIPKKTLVPKREKSTKSGSVLFISVNEFDDILKNNDRLVLIDSKLIYLLSIILNYCF
jgi:hypothetical protein